MRHCIYILFTFLLLAAPARVAAQADFTILEVLIQQHKKTSDRLKQRIATQGTAAATELLREDRTDQVKLKVDTLTQRNKLAMSDLTLLFDAVGIIADTREVVQITSDAIDLALQTSVRYPDVLDRAVYLENRAGEKIEDIYKLVASVISSGIGASLATNEQRFQFVQEIKSRITWIRINMMEFYKFCSSRQRMGSDGTVFNLDEIIKMNGPGIQKAYDNAVQSIGKLNLW